eukprot:6181562-Pleurochrysis_carterae.AAC.6
MSRTAASRALGTVWPAGVDICPWQDRQTGGGVRGLHQQGGAGAFTLCEEPAVHASEELPGLDERLAGEAEDAKSRWGCEGRRRGAARISSRLSAGARSGEERKGEL